jgi:hypothetical protein
MWRRACLGSTDDLWTLAVTYVWRRNVWNGLVSRQAPRGMAHAETWLRFQEPDA